MVLLLTQGSFAFASQCGGFFQKSQAAVQINGKDFLNVELNNLIRNFNEPVTAIVLVNSRYEVVYLGVSAREQYQGLLETHLMLYEKGIVHVIRAMNENLKRALMNAKDVNEAKEVFTQYFLNENGITSLENDSIIHFTLNADNITGIKASLNSDGTINDLRIGPIESGLYILRIQSKDTNKEISFRVKDSEI